MTNNEHKIAIIVGAGAVENAWKPIENIFRLLYQYEVNSDIANCLFARNVYLLRFYSKFQNNESVENLKEQKDKVKLLKELICEQLKKAQEFGIIRPREEFAKVLYKFAFNNPNTKFGLVSTNWDTVIDIEADRLVKQAYKDIESSKCFHLHGSVESPNGLYLPSEMGHENYRTEEENDLFGFNHYATLKFLREANQILLYGISLDPLDAELSQILNSAFESNNLKEI